MQYPERQGLEPGLKNQFTWEELGRRIRWAVDHRLLDGGVAHRALLLAGLEDGRVARDAVGSSKPLSGEELATALGISRAAVHKHVAQLRELGLKIDSSKGVGYRLCSLSSELADSSTDNLLAAEAVMPHLLALQDPAAGPVVGLPYYYLPECSSTNELLRRFAPTASPGTVLVTDRQTAGRGRLERRWFSQPAKDLTFSVLLHPSLLPTQAHLLSLAAALAVAEVLEKLVDPGEVKIKWPNDVLLAGRKVCGILLEGSLDTDRLRWVIVGVGLNVNSDPALLAREVDDGTVPEWQGRPAPVSLGAFAARHFPRAPLLAALLARLGQRCGPSTDGVLATSVFLEELRARDALHGREVEVLAGSLPGQVLVKGEAIGLGAEGQLLVRSSSGAVMPVFVGDVTVCPKGDRESGQWV